MDLSTESEWIRLQNTQWNHGVQWISNQSTKSKAGYDFGPLNKIQMEQGTESLNGIPAEPSSESLNGTKRKAKEHVNNSKKQDMNQFTQFRRLNDLKQSTSAQLRMAQ
ncbi:hypothetical protein ACFX19_003280 [Malus domestica]